MKPSIQREVDALRDLTVAELRERYLMVFGEPTTSRHRVYLQKRIAWRLQAREHGGLSDRALRRAEELANESDLRLVAPKSGAGRTVVGSFNPSHDKRIPMPGTVLVREYRGETIAVTVLDQGFEYRGEVYRSLSAAARVVTGSHWNGLLFFGLTGKGTKR